jgi:glutathione S-transferase
MEFLMITLYAFTPAFGLPDASPFVMKAMLLLNLAGQPYTIDSFTGGPNVGPKGKRPFIVDDGITVADSTFIRFHLENKYGIDFDSHLSPQQKSVAWAVEKMCEDHLYFAAVYFRWMKDENFKKGPATFFKSAPALIRPIIRTVVRNNVRKTLHAQGLGRHTEAEIAELASRDIDALALILGDANWFGGASPCAADACVGAFILTSLCEHFDTPLLAKTRSHGNLVSYANRVQRLFSEKINDVV